jgi:hypothetical protein
MEQRSRTVSFRLSPSEYADAVQICCAHGYRSLSLFARSALLAFSADATYSQAHNSEIKELRERIDIIAAELLRISAKRNGNAQEMDRAG